MRRPTNVGSCVRLLTEQDRLVLRPGPLVSRSAISISRRSRANDQRRSCLPATRRGGWRRTLPAGVAASGDECSVPMMQAESFPRLIPQPESRPDAAYSAPLSRRTLPNGARNSTQSRVGEFRGWAYLPAKNAKLSISRWPRNGRPWPNHAVKCVASLSPPGWSWVAGCIISALMIPLAQRPHYGVVDTSCLPDFAERP